MDARWTTGRFGLHEVPELLLSHRDLAAAPAAVWVSAPVPLSVEDVAGMLYATREPGESSSVASVRHMICDITVNGGTMAVADMLYEAGQHRATGGRGAAAHWSACLRLARAVAPHDAAVVGSACSPPALAWEPEVSWGAGR